MNIQVHSCIGERTNLGTVPQSSDTSFYNFFFCYFKTGVMQEVGQACSENPLHPLLRLQDHTNIPIF